MDSKERIRDARFFRAIVKWNWNVIIDEGVEKNYTLMQNKTYMFYQIHDNY